MISSLWFSTNSSAILAADTSSAQSVYSDSKVAIESKVLSAYSGVMSFNNENSFDDFLICAYTAENEDYYVDNYDAQGNILYYAFQERNVSIQYETRGDKIIRSDLGMMNSVGDESGIISL